MSFFLNSGGFLLCKNQALPFVQTCRLTAAHSYAYAAELPAAGAPILAVFVAKQAFVVNHRFAHFAFAMNRFAGVQILAAKINKNTFFQ